MAVSFSDIRVCKDFDNSSVVLWQYDRANDFKRLLQMREDAANASVTDVVNRFFNDVFNIDTATRFGLWIWGNVLGQKWPTYTETKDGVKVTRYVDVSVYRRVLKAKFFLLTSNGSTAAINEYLSLLFDTATETAQDPHRDRKIRNANRIVLHDLQNADTIYKGFRGPMSIGYEFEWSLNPQDDAIRKVIGILPHPAAVDINGGADRIIPTRYFGFGGLYYGNFSKVDDPPTKIRQISKTDREFLAVEVSIGNNATALVSPPEPYFYNIGTAANPDFYLVSKDVFDNGDGTKRVVYYYLVNGADGKAVKKMISGNDVSSICYATTNDEGETVYTPMTERIEAGSLYYYYSSEDAGSTAIAGIADNTLVQVTVDLSSGIGDRVFVIEIKETEIKDDGKVVGYNYEEVIHQITGVDGSGYFYTIGEGEDAIKVYASDISGDQDCGLFNGSIFGPDTDNV